MKHRLLNLLTALSLLLCVAVVALWIPSYRSSFEATGLTLWPKGAGYAAGGVVAKVTAGAVVVECVFGSLSEPKLDGTEPGIHFERYPIQVSGQFVVLERWREVAGFGIVNELWTDPPPEWLSIRQVGACVPAWFATVALAALPAGRFVRAQRRRWRRSRSLCVRCGYDLRATPGRCPECGTAPGVITTT